MNRSEILDALDTEIARLLQARTLLADSPELPLQVEAARRGPGRPKGSTKVATKKAKTAVPKRTMSSEGRARIAAAQKARWAKLHKSAKKTVAPSKPAKKAVKKTSEKKAVAKKTPATAKPEAANS